MSIETLLFLLATLDPCPTEDSYNCHWDATTQGNGVGTSFVDIGGVAYYYELGLVPAPISPTED